MIPVPITELIEYNIDAEEDVKYKELIKDEWIYIRSNKQKILNYAKVMYKQKNEKQEIGYVNSALDYKKLELLCKEFEMKKNVENDKSTFERIYDVVKQIPYGKVQLHFSYMY